MNERISISVKDNGIGIPVNKLDGKIYLKSQPSKGSEFIVEIPCMTTPETSEFNIENTSVNNIVERAKIEFSDIYC
jgi:signal transduction histidine kinase